VNGLKRTKSEGKKKRERERERERDNQSPLSICSVISLSAA